MARGGAGRAAALGLALRLLLLLGLGLEAAPAPAVAPTQVQVSGPRAGSCPTDNFQCITNGYCVPLSWRCDGDPDCSDGSDEEECRIEPCAQKGQCQPLATLPCSCDNISGCPAGSDKNLLNCSRQPCQEGELRCVLGDVCIPHTWRCDGHPDCPDSSDELSCDTNIETDKIFQEENATTTRTPMTLENETSLRNATVASAGNPSRNPNAYGVIAAAGFPKDCFANKQQEQFEENDTHIPKRWGETCWLLAAPIYFREDMDIEENAYGANFHCGQC